MALTAKELDAIRLRYSDLADEGKTGLWFDSAHVGQLCDDIDALVAEIKRLKAMTPHFGTHLERDEDGKVLHPEEACCDSHAKEVL